MPLLTDNRRALPASHGPAQRRSSGRALNRSRVLFVAIKTRTFFFPYQVNTAFWCEVRSTKTILSTVPV